MQVNAQAQTTKQAHQDPFEEYRRERLGLEDVAPALPTVEGPSELDRTRAASFRIIPLTAELGGIR